LLPGEPQKINVKIGVFMGKTHGKIMGNGMPWEYHGDVKQ
jgi:hypothetical protein